MKIQYLLLLLLPLFLLTCKKKAMDELSLDDIIKQQETYYRSLPDWEKLRYTRKDEAALVYELKGKVESLEEKQVDRPSGGWNPNTSEVAKCIRSYRFDEEGRLLEFTHTETVDNKEVTKDRTVVSLRGDTIIKIETSKESGYDVSISEFEYMPFGNFKKVIDRRISKIDGNNGITSTTYKRDDVIYTYNDTKQLTNRRWITYSELEGENNDQYKTSIDTTFDTKGYPVESYHVGYHYGTRPNDTLKITRIEFKYNNKNELDKVIIDNVFEEYVTQPAQVRVSSPITKKAMTPRHKIEYKTYDPLGNWTEMWVYENEVIPNNPSYKISRTKIEYHD